MIIDTSVVLAATERRSPQAIRAIRNLDGPSVRSWIVQAELATGVRTARPEDRPMRQASSDFYLKISTATNNVSRFDLVERFAELALRAKTLDARIGQNDLWILAEAQEEECGVLTADVAMHRVGKPLRLTTLVKSELGPMKSPTVT